MPWSAKAKLAAVTLAAASTLGVGFAAAGSANAATMVDVTIKVTSNGWPPPQQPSVDYWGTGVSGMPCVREPTPTLRLHVPQNAKITLASIQGCYSSVAHQVTINVGNGGTKYVRL
jgi:hypothetical protein